MILLLSLHVALAAEPSPTNAERPSLPVGIDQSTPVRTITFDANTFHASTFDADRINRLGMGNNLYGVFSLVPGHHQGTRMLGGHGRGDVAVMLDGVVLRSDGMMGPMP